ncbi:hypothetical protein [Phaeodactylibacter luteus]|uniref:Uncharacterized protein n=1 Tax=Phaeodactylibacter luteus TaxID=1564516 RepID=A0A5C6S429_9BACT|nr:hypothetical protein [Phaeodactylibacter luteus]TXB68292.1 hypothetical protein FRY97_02620 [Phaeodactylibacter luteus]
MPQKPTRRQIRIDAAPDKVATIVRQCGNDPDGNFNCTETVYDDGADCLIIDNQGAPSGIHVSGPGC